MFVDVICQRNSKESSSWFRWLVLASGSWRWWCPAQWSAAERCRARKKRWRFGTFWWVFSVTWPGGFVKILFMKFGMGNVCFKCMKVAQESQLEQTTSSTTHGLLKVSRLQFASLGQPPAALAQVQAAFPRCFVAPHCQCHCGLQNGKWHVQCMPLRCRGQGRTDRCCAHLRLPLKLLGLRVEKREIWRSPWILQLISLDFIWFLNLFHLISLHLMSQDSLCWVELIVSKVYSDRK